ncbi:hypothetical protein ACTXT7_015427 [Hymenolepis weldensis]
MSKVVVQNAGEAVLSYHQQQKISLVNVPWSHINLSLTEPIRGIFYLVLDFCRDLNISLLHSPPNLNGLDEQLVGKGERQIIVSQEETVEEIINPLKFGDPPKPHFDVQIRVLHCKILRSQYVILTFKPKMNLTEIYLDTCNLPPPWNPEIPEVRQNHRSDRYCGRFGRHRKFFNVGPTLKLTNKQLWPGGVE